MSYLRYNLQLFAKDGPGGEKTEPATDKKLSDARKEGQVAKSQEIVNAVYLLAIFYVLKFLLSMIGNGIMESFSSVYGIIPTYAESAEDMRYIGTAGFIMKEIILKIVVITAPIFIISFLVNFVGELVQVKWKPTAKPMMPKFSKLNPISGFKRIFSKQSLINLLKSVAIVGICIYIVYQAWLDNYGIIFRLYDMSLMEAIAAVGDLVLDICIDISMVYFVVGIADYVFQKRKFSQDMKMTKQEVKDEYKNTEGDPAIRGQQKRRMREASQRRMMQQLPQADVVITNPTHFAVALKYDLEIAKAPVVLAKGEDFLAQKIKEAAKENNIEIYENKPLARALYQSVDVGEEIPPELYQAVAEVLAFVYSLKNK
ncbi:MAG: flagellar biosynthesis protein FlhB [Lachnospiraceae bacterium]